MKLQLVLVTAIPLGLPALDLPVQAALLNGDMMPERCETGKLDRSRDRIDCELEIHTAYKQRQSGQWFEPVPGAIRAIGNDGLDSR